METDVASGRERVELVAHDPDGHAKRADETQARRTWVCPCAYGCACVSGNLSLCVCARARVFVDVTCLCTQSGSREYLSILSIELCVCVHFG